MAHPHNTKIIAWSRLKNDKVDSEALADLLRLNAVSEAYVPDKYYRDMRTLARNRTSLVRMVAVHKNKIHATLAKYEHVCPTKSVFTQKGMVWLRAIDLSPIDRLSVDTNLDLMELENSKIEDMEKKMAIICQKDERAKLLMSIPGIGIVIAQTILAEVVDIGRFPDSEKFVSHTGLAPSHRSSGDTHHGGRITKKGSKHLRSALVNAATVAIQHDPRLKTKYTELKPRLGPPKAKVAIARRLAVICWNMLTHGEEYRTKNVDLTSRKLRNLEKKAG